MLKLAGAVLCMTAGLSMGMAICRETGRTLDCLNALTVSLGVIHSELASRLAPMHELMKAAAEVSTGSVHEFAKEVYIRTEKLDEMSFEDIWKDCCRKRLRELKPEDMRKVSGLGCILGKTALEEQLRAVSDVRTQLCASADEIAKVYPARKKTVMGLSCSAGLIVTIMFL